MRVATLPQKMDWHKNAVFLQLQTRRNIKNVRRCGELSANSNDQCKHGSESAFTRGRGMFIHGY